MTKSNNSTESITRLRKLKSLLAEHNYLAEVNYSSDNDEYTIVIPGDNNFYECRCSFNLNDNIMISSYENENEQYSCPEYALSMLMLGYAAYCMSMVGYNVRLAKCTMDGVEIDKFPSRLILDPEEKEKGNALKKIMFNTNQKERILAAQEAGVLDGYMAIRNFFEDSDDE